MLVHWPLWAREGRYMPSSLTLAEVRMSGKAKGTRNGHRSIELLEAATKPRRQLLPQTIEARRADRAKEKTQLRVN